MIATASLPAFSQPFACLIAQRRTVRPCSSGLVRKADSCYSATDCIEYTYTLTNTHTHKLLWEGSGLSYISSNQTSTRQSSVWKFGHGKRPGVRASTLMAFFWVVFKGYGLLFPVFVPSRCVCVIDGSLIEQRAPTSSHSQLSVPRLSVASQCSSGCFESMQVCVCTFMFV